MQADISLLDGQNDREDTIDILDSTDENIEAEEAFLLPAEEIHMDDEQEEEEEEEEEEDEDVELSDGR